jgi:hypothetical protein
LWKYHQKGTIPIKIEKTRKKGFLKNTSGWMCHAFALEVTKENTISTFKKSKGFQRNPN